MKLLREIRGLGAAFAVVAMIGMAGCEEEGAAEKAGKKLDNAAEEMGKSLDEMKKNLDGK